MFNSILLQAEQGSGFDPMQIVFFAGIALVFYFFMIRPQQKKQKDQKKFINEIKKGDAVVTIGGIKGKVVEVDDTSITLDVDRGSKITFQKTAISKDSSAGIEEKK
jgi:preprotein translocase subunit YajC